MIIKYNSFVLLLISIINLSNAVEFRLFTRDNPDDYKISTLDKIDRSYFAFNKTDTVFIVHGFNSNGAVKWALDIKTGLLLRKDANVFIVDWSKDAANFDYKNVSTAAPLIGERVAKLIELLEIPPKRVHCIGHSLGAHVCGFCGQNVHIGRISGMDPAGPEFYVKDPYRLSSDDADFVDVIHTSFSLGQQQSIGHIDFFVNGGLFQPGCSLIMPICSHTRAAEYYAESLTSSTCKFKAHKCRYSLISWIRPNWCRDEATMGIDAILSDARGLFYLSTNSQSPFCKD